MQMLVIVYIAAIVLANLSIGYFGPNVAPLNAFLFIGLDLAIRNYLAITFTPVKMLVAADRKLTV